MPRTFNLVKTLLPIAIILISLPILVAGIKIARYFLPKAASAPPYSVEINPGQITAYPHGDPIYMSALAYNDLHQPIFDDIVYEWGISSTNSIGTILVNIQNTAIATFYPSASGSGDLWVIARSTSGQAMHSIPVCIGNCSFPTPIPPPPPFPSPIPSPYPISLNGSLACTGTASNKINLNWNSYPGTYSYFVEQCTGLNCANFTSVIGGPNLLSWQTTSSPSQINRFRINAQVGAVNQGLTYHYSNIVTITDNCPPPTPTPTPKPNTPPTITTSSLTTGKVGVPYSAAIFGQDTDIQDTVSLSLQIPTGYGLIAGPCAINKLTPYQIECTIFGTPTKPTSFPIPVTATITDNHGGTARKTFPLTILPATGKLWNFTAKAVCSDGSTPTQPTTIISTLWPPDPLVWQYTSANSITIASANPTLGRAGYLGLISSSDNPNWQQKSLEPISPSPLLQSLTVGQFFNPLSWMAKWQQTDLPEGAYNLTFKAPASWCPIVYHQTFTCGSTQLYQDNPNNNKTPGQYYLTNPISSTTPLLPGQTFVYAISPIKNNSSASLPNTFIAASLDSRLEYVDAGSGCQPSGQSIKCTLGTFAPGGATSKAIRVRVKPTTTSGKITFVPTLYSGNIIADSCPNTLTVQDRTTPIRIFGKQFTLPFPPIRLR